MRKRRVRKQNELPFLKSFLESSKHKKSLLPYLPENLAEEMRGQCAVLNFQDFLSEIKWADGIHYSWFYPVLKPLPKSLQMAFLTLLPHESRESVAKLLNLTIQETSVSRPARSFLLHFLKEKIMKTGVLPQEEIPYSEIHILLDLDKGEILHLIDLMGIYDLAQDVRQIVDKNLLEKIYSALGKEMRQFLEYCQKLPVKWISPKMNLQNWDGSKKQLHLLIHQRGLFRMSLALQGENPHFLWHLFHKLDTGRVKVIETNQKQKQEPALTNYFKKQIIDLVVRLKK